VQYGKKELDKDMEILKQKSKRNPESKKFLKVNKKYIRKPLKQTSTRGKQKFSH
jgi:hypothetical protein